MGRDRARIDLPHPPLEYDAAYERARNARIEDLISSRAAINELAPYGGVPHAALNGNNAAFSLPGNNVMTILPFNTVFIPNANILDSSVPVFKLKYTMNVLSFLQLQHVSGAGGNTTIVISGLVNNVVVVSSTSSVALNDNEVYSRTVIFKDVPPNQTLQFGFAHSGNNPLIMDMVRSRWYLCQLTPDPRYTISETR